MILIAHIIIALSSLVFTTRALINPSASKFRVSYLFIAATVASGTYMTFQYPAHFTESCTVGIAYLATVSALTYFAERKFKRLQTEKPHIYARSK